MVGELLDGAQLGEGLARRLFGYLAYQSVKLGETLASGGISLVTERPRHHGARQQADVAFSTLKSIFGTYRTLAKTRVGLVTRIVAKVHTCATLLLGKGVRPKIVQELLGHATIVITLDSFSYVLPHIQGEAVTAMEGVLS